MEGNMKKKKLYIYSVNSSTSVYIPTPCNFSHLRGRKDISILDDNQIIKMYEVCMPVTCEIKHNEGNNRSM